MSKPKIKKSAKSLGTKENEKEQDQDAQSKEN